MPHFIHRNLIATLLMTAIALSAIAEEQRCPGTAKECDQQIRHFLSGRRFLGATVKDRNPGLFIESVTPNGPAERAGLQKGDRLIACNTKSVAHASTREFKQILAEARQGGALTMIVFRRGGYKRVNARLEPYTKQQIDQIIAAHLSQSHPSSAGGNR
jgi:predicted metalloprotease with PDZ domain